MKRKMANNFLMHCIRKADGIQVDEILDAAVARRKELFPEWDMMYIALPKNDKEACIRNLTQHLEMIKRL